MKMTFADGSKWFSSSSRHQQQESQEDPNKQDKDDDDKDKGASFCDRKVFSKQFLFITTSQRSCMKVMFLHVSVILSTEGGACVAGGHV